MSHLYIIGKIYKDKFVLKIKFYNHNVSTINNHLIWDITSLRVKSFFRGIQTRN